MLSVYALLIIVIALLGWATSILLHKPNILTYVYKGLLTVGYISLGAINYFNAPAQLQPLGFASGDRNPNHFLYIVSYIIAAYALITIFLIYKKTKLHPLINFGVVGAVTILLYVASW